jgi:hypothetical protein
LHSIWDTLLHKVEQAGQVRWDDFTPVEYIRRQMKTKWLGCFSEEDVRADEERLRRMLF